MVRIFIVALFSVLPLLSWADVYTVTNVSATVPIHTGASMPREQALNKAVRSGFTQLLRKLTPPSAWSRHAWLLSSVSPEVALEKVKIVSENTGEDYTLTADLTFKRDMLRQLLADHGIPFSETDTATVLLMPVYEVANAQILWDDTNPWRQALQSHVLRDGVLTFTLPAGDITEMSRLTPTMAIAGAQDVFVEMARNYNAAVVVVARAKIQQKGAYGMLAVQADWYPTTEQNKEKKWPSVRFNMPLPMQGMSEQVLGDASAKLYRELENIWQQTGMVAADKPAQAYLRYPASSPKDAYAFETSLRGLSSVFDVTPRLMSQTEIVNEVHFFGQFSTLQEQLLGLGFRLSREGHLWRVHKVQQ